MKNFQDYNIHQMRHRIEFREIPGKGQGVFCARNFKAGDIISVGTVQKILKKNEPGAIQIGNNEFMLFAGLMSRVNHSCKPNCGIREAGEVYELIALRDGKRDEEVTFDYAMQNYSIDYFTQNCACGAIDCRGHITGWKDLSEEKRKEYVDYVAPYLLELDQRDSNEEPQTKEQ
jgi:hypothetical protein